MLAFILIINIFGLVNNVATKDISCEEIESTEWDFPVLTVKTCFMEESTAINEENFKISSRDEIMGGLTYLDNKKVSHLPVQVTDSFPNLQAYSGESCSIKKVSKTNFARLSNLKFLYLGYNQIETIYSDTFEDLISLEELRLSRKS
jgi:Leucine-rich repeat (LRR) protein